MQILGSTSLKEILVQTYEAAEDCLKTNYYGTKQLTDAFLPLLQKSEAARIVNVSSALGQLRVQNRIPTFKALILKYSPDNMACYVVKLLSKLFIVSIHRCFQYVV